MIEDLFRAWLRYGAVEVLVLSLSNAIGKHAIQIEDRAQINLSTGLLKALDDYRKAENDT